MKHVEFNINGFVGANADYLVELMDILGVLDVGEYTVTMFVTED